MTKDQTHSEALWKQAQTLLPGGVNSPVRAFGAVGGTPVFLRSGIGPRVEDVDGNTYLDYVGSWGPLILGHADPRVTAAVQQALLNGTTFGAPTAAEVEMAQRLVDAVPSLEKVRLVNSGTEATMSAIRVARGFTGRPKIIKIAGCYHGHGDYLLVRAGSGATTFGVPTSAGVPDDFARHTLIAPFNDAEAIAELARRFPGEIACLILEPIAGNMGLVPPEDGYLQALRDITAEHEILLIFDEVMTGFRVAYGGAQERYGVTPDMTCLGKIVGGGLPVGAYGGRADVMARVAPEGPVYQAGTLSGNPLATAAGIAMLKALQEPGVYEYLEARSTQLEAGIAAALDATGVTGCVTRVGSMVGFFFAEPPIRNYDDACKSDTQRYARFFHGLLSRGVYFPPSQFETFFVSVAHTEADIEQTVTAIRDALDECQ
jgi:glutamate-1-semialdehyde 2,1-aminomutase